jgi:hypothetical protein
MVHNPEVLEFLETNDQLVEQAEKLRASGLLGRTRLLRLFDFLVDATLRDESPKGSVIAVTVFGHRHGAGAGEDTSVRVYVHNLRRQLDAYYKGAGRNEPLRISIPKGAYRLVLEPWGAPAADTVAAVAVVPGPHGPRPGNRLVGALAALCALLALALVVLWARRTEPTPADLAAAGPVWAPLLANGRPTLLVMGDYYLVGDAADGIEVRRLVREFTINSRSDLEQFLSSNPKMASRYMDVGLGYLPTSSAFALDSVLPVLAARSRVAPRVVVRSDLDPELLRTANVVYLGLLSGLGDLRGTVFAASRFTLGDSYDELVDSTTHRHYVSEVSPLGPGAGSLAGPPHYRDYAYVTTFLGPSGNRYVVIAGMRDEGLRQAGEWLGSRANLDALSSAAHDRSDFEALIEVTSLDRINLTGRTIAVAPRDSGAIWGQH